jgi:hypothetical protein
MTRFLTINAPENEIFGIQSLNAGPISVTCSEGAPYDTYVLKPYPSCAAVRSDIALALNYQLLVVRNRGIFYRTTDAGTDTGTELTEYIGTSGNGFIFSPIYYADFSYIGDPSFRPGRCNFDGNSFNVCTDITGVIVQVGEENQVPVYNNETVTVPNGYAVYASGAQGQRLAVNKYANGTTLAGLQFVGLMTHDSSSHSNSRVTNFGLVHELNTQGLSVSGLVYTTATPGVFSQTLPAGTVEAIEIGVVVQAHPNQGTIMVRPRYLPRLAGTTANRPTVVREGEYYLDTTLNKPIWRRGSGWIDATGTSV